MLVAVILMSLGVWALRQNKGRARFLILGAVGAILVGCSHASVFVLGGIGLTLIGTALADRRYRDVLGWVIVSSTWFLIFLTIYLFVDRYSASNSYLVQFWAKKFAPFPPRSLEQAKWYYDNALVGLFTGPLGMSQGQLAATGFFFGVYLLAIRGQERLLILLVSPLLLALAASALKKYPFVDRCLLFACPMLATLIATGIAGIKVDGVGAGGVLLRVRSRSSFSFTPRT